MSLIMTATPLSMKFFNHGVSGNAQEIQGHVVGMFAPSLFTGSLIERFGYLRIIETGLWLNLLCIAVKLIGQGLLYWSALLLSESGGTSCSSLELRCSPQLTLLLKKRRSGFQRLHGFCHGGSFSLLAGALQHWVGWISVNHFCLLFLVITGMMLNWHRTRKVEDADPT